MKGVCWWRVARQTGLLEVLKECDVVWLEFPHFYEGPRMYLVYSPCWDGEGEWRTGAGAADFLESVERCEGWLAEMLQPQSLSVVENWTIAGGQLAQWKK